MGALAGNGGKASGKFPPAKAARSADSALGNSSRPPCSYAAVFDGHSAADAADMAAKRLHVLLAGELGASDRCSI